VLSDTCPASFELNNDGGCVAQSLSRLPSLRDAGCGRPKEGLAPAARGLFTPNRLTWGATCFLTRSCRQMAPYPAPAATTRHRDLPTGRRKPRRHQRANTPRSAPSLWNVGFLSRSCGMAPKPPSSRKCRGPLYSPIEMGNTPRNCLETLNANNTYRALFEQAFGTTPISLDQIYTAITAFESSLISLNSRYDLYAHGYHAALNEEEIAGLNVFRSFVARCAECHTPPLFTNQQLAVLGVADAPGELLDPAPGPSPAMPASGARSVCRACAIWCAPRPICTAARKRRWQDAARFYTGGRGHEVPEGESLMIHWHIWEPRLTDQEISLLVTFYGRADRRGVYARDPIGSALGTARRAREQRPSCLSGNDRLFGAQ
jgi:cytochrome c peroxidase